MKGMQTLRKAPDLAAAVQRDGDDNGVCSHATAEAGDGQRVL